MKDYFFDMWATFKAKLAGAPKSWTLWFNSIGALLIEFLPHAAEALPALYGMMPQNYYSVALIVLVGGNMFLRFKTNKDLAKK